MQHAKPTRRKLKKIQTTALMKRMMALLCAATLVLSTPLQSLAYDTAAAEELGLTASESTETTSDSAEDAAESTEDANTDGTDGIDGADGTDSSADSTDATEENSAADTSDTSDTDATSPIVTDTATLLSNIQTLATQTITGVAHEITIDNSLNANGDNYDYTLPSDARGWIYVNDIRSSSSNLSISSDGNTLTNGSITITLNAEGLSFDTSYANAAYRVVAETPTRGTTVTYGSSSSPAITITITNAGYTSSGRAVDIVYTIPTVSVYSYQANSGTASILRFLDDQSLTLEGFQFEAHTLSASTTLGYGIGIFTDCTVSIYYSGTNTLASGYGFVWKVVDLDMPSRADSNDYYGSYAERIVFKSGFTNPIYTTTSSYLTARTVEIDGIRYASLRGTRNDNDTLNSGFMTTLTTGTFSFQWRGAGCSTGFCVGLSQDSYSAGLTIGKTVSGNNPDTTKEFSYTLKLDGSGLDDIGGTSYTLSKSDDTSDTITFDESSKVATATFTLKADQTVFIYDLPTGVTYTVQQITTDSNYSSTITGPGTTDNDTLTASGVVSSDSLTTVVFDSERLSGNLSISKTVSKTYADTSDETFKFTVSLYDVLLTQNLEGDFSISYYSNSSSGDPAATGTVTLAGGQITSVTAGSTGTITNVVASDGTISLGDGASVTISGLPSGVTYTVVETEDLNYTTSWSVNDGGTTSFDTTNTATGTISEAGSTVKFTNTLATFTLTIYKYTGDDDDETDTPGTGLDGAVFSVVAVSGSTDTSDKGGTTENGGKLVITGLEVGVVYKVSEEKVPSGYTYDTLQNPIYIKVEYDSDTSALKGYLVEEEDGTYTTTSSELTKTTDGSSFLIKVHNEKIASLPQTGGSGTLYIFASGIALMTLAAYALYRQRRGMSVCAAHAFASHAASPYQAFKSSSYASHASTSQARTSSPYVSHAPTYQARAASRPQPTRRRTH